MFGQFGKAEIRLSQTGSYTHAIILHIFISIYYAQICSTRELYIYMRTSC